MTTLTSATPIYGNSMMPGSFPRPGAPGAGGGPAFSTQDVVRALRQRIVMIILIWLFFCGLTVAGTLYAQKYHPEYEANALIRVESLAPPDPNDPLRRESGKSPADIERELQNQTLIVRSPEVLAKALADPELQRTQWYKEAKLRSKNEKLEDLLLDVLSVGPVPESNLLQVSATWRDKKEVPTIVNAVVEQYVNAVDERQKKYVTTQKEQLTAELERTQTFLKNKREEIDRFQNANAYSEADLQEAIERALTLSAIATELELEITGRKSQWESLQNARPEDLPITPDLQNLLNNDRTLYELEQRMMAAQQILDQALQRYGPNHRVVKEATMNRDAAALAFQQDRASKVVLFNARQIQLARQSYLEANTLLVAQKDQLYQAISERRDKEAKKAQFDALLAERDRLLVEYEKQLDQKNMLEIIIRQQKTVQIEIASKATTPERMSSPEILVWIPGGAMFGLFFAVGFAMLLELADKSVRTPRDVARAHVPVLGTIPTTDDDEVEIDRVESACLDAPHSVVAEAFRNLRANLFFSAPAEQQGVILVTSPSGGNGKTTIASNLAISIALSGRRVLLIDSNFRRPALPRVFPNMRPEGLSNILIGQGELKDYVTRTNVPGLDVMSSGPLPPNPAELLGSSYLRDVVVDARSRYDQVIFDGPPVLLVSDAMVLAGAVDGVLLICEYRNTLRGALQRTQSNLEAINVRIFGAVLNKVQSRAGGYFRKGYREYYDYHEADDDAPQQRPQLDARQSTMGPDDHPQPRNGGPGGGAAAGVLEAETALHRVADQTEEDAYGAQDQATSDSAVDAIELEEPVAEAPVVDDEPPMATTIDEYDTLTEEDALPPMRDIGEPPAPPEPPAPVEKFESPVMPPPAPPAVEEFELPDSGADSGLIPDMKDVEDLDDFDIPPEPSASIAPPAPTPKPATEWSAPEFRSPPPTVEPTLPLQPESPAEPETPVEADAPQAPIEESAPVEIDDSMLAGEEEIVIGEDEDEDDNELKPLGDIGLLDEPSPLDTPESLDETPAESGPETTSQTLADDSAFDMLEDEIDLGDDLTDLDSDEFRIDDKWDLDDDFEDPDSDPSKPKQ